MHYLLIKIVLFKSNKKEVHLKHNTKNSTFFENLTFEIIYSFSITKIVLFKSIKKEVY